MFLVPNGLKELPEMRFEYLSNLIGKSIVAFLTGSLWRVLKSWYTGGAPQQGFQCRFADGLNQTFTSVCEADTCSQVSQFTVWLQIKVAHYLNIDEGLCTPELFNHVTVIVHGAINNCIWIIHLPFPLCSNRVGVMSVKQLESKQ